MSWCLERVPKVVHFYFGAHVFPYLRYESIASVIKYNPGWVVKLHVPCELGNVKAGWSCRDMVLASGRVVENYSDRIENLGVQIIRHDFSKYGFSNSAHEVHKSDFLRWYLLSTEGGIWADTDILFVKSMDEMSCNNSVNYHADAGLCVYGRGNGHAIGFLFSAPNSSVYKMIYDRTLQRYSKDNCQCIGSELFNSLFGISDSVDCVKRVVPNSNPLFINPSTVYSLDVGMVDEFLNPHLKVSDFPDAIGFHWYGGYRKTIDIEMSMNESNVTRDRSFIDNIVLYIRDN